MCLLRNFPHGPPAIARRGRCSKTNLGYCVIQLIGFPAVAEGCQTAGRDSQYPTSYQEGHAGNVRSCVRGRRLGPAEALGRDTRGSGASGDTRRWRPPSQHNTRTTGSLQLRCQSFLCVASPRGSSNVFRRGQTALSAQSADRGSTRWRTGGRRTPRCLRLLHNHLRRLHRLFRLRRCLSGFG
jgi:hypothetical protein